jgi:hypothetical protein
MAGQTYSFLDVSAAIVGPGGGFSFSGADAANAKEGFTAEFIEDKNAMTVGANGSVMHSLRAGKAGKIIVRLLKTSPINQLLSALYNFQTVSSATHGQNAITITDFARGDVYTCQQCAFSRFASNTYAEDGGMLEWNFDVGVMDPLLGTGSPAL